MIKTLIQIVLLLVFLNCDAQSSEPFLEQIAFDFYKTQILKDSKIKFKVTRNLNSVYDISAECLIDKITDQKSNNYKKSKYFQGYTLDFRTSKKFKVVKEIKENTTNKNFIRVSITKIFNERLFVIIHEFQKSEGKIYTIELDKEGNIIDWCLSSKLTMLIIY